MRILFLTQWFDPETHHKGLSFALALQKRGHTVQVLTGYPNYPGGKLYPGYKIRLWQHEVMEGVPVVRVALFPSHSKSAIGRIFNYFSFAASSSTIGMLLIKNADVAYVYHPPATIGFPALTIKYFRKIPIVYDIQDLWPDTLTATGMVTKKWMLQIVSCFCKIIYKYVDQISVQSPGIKKCLIQRGVKGEKISVIYNWSQFVPNSSSNHLRIEKKVGKFIILFAGNLGAAQGLDTILHAANHLKALNPDICFALAGSGVEESRLQQRVKTEGLCNVVFFKRRPPSEMGPLYFNADALLVHLKDDPLFSITIPAKTQTCLAAGKPILMGVRGEAAKLVEQAGAGIIFSPEDHEDLVKAIQKIYFMTKKQREDLGAAGKDFYNQKLSEEVGVKAIETLMFQAAKIKKIEPKASVDTH